MSILSTIDRRLTVKESPFTNADEAISFIKENNSKLFFIALNLYYRKILDIYAYLFMALFPIYLLMCSIIFLFDYPEEVNAMLFYFLRAHYIPVRYVDGWNLSYIMAFLFNFGAFIFFAKRYNLRWLKKVIKIKKRHLLGRYLGRGLTLLIIIPIILVVIFFGTKPPRSSSCTRHSFCWLQSDDQFLYSAVVLYATWWLIFLIFYIIFFGERKINKNIFRVREDLIDSCAVKPAPTKK